MIRDATALPSAALLRATAGARHSIAPSAPAAAAPAARRDGKGAAAGIGRPEDRLSERQRAALQELRATDQKVRAHERAHAAAAGSYARGGPQYTYTRGPDGRLYATSGEVSIDASPVPGDPRATLQKAEQIQRAALAPAEPSAQDQAVAAQATALALQARADLQAERGDNAGPPDTPRVDATASGERAEPGACPSCGGHHGPGAHGDNHGTVERTYRANAATNDVARTLLIATV